jgi:hypothetical protein
VATTAARRALPSDPAPRSQASQRPEATTATDVEPPAVPVSRTPMIVIGVAAAACLLLLGIWLGSVLGR